MEPLEYIKKKYELGRYGESVPIILSKVFRIGMYELFNDLGYKIGCEVGVREGRNAGEMIQKIPGLMLYLVDPYKNHSSARRKYSEKHYDRTQRRAHQRLDKLNVKFFEMFSEQAVEFVEDNSLDFVYIDADHDYDFAMQDIIIWSRKVRSGGIVSGHDYYLSRRHGHRGVTHAVIDYSKMLYISPWFLTSSREEAKERNEYGLIDTLPSWFWVKP